jgi:ribosomal protein S18 acetylase RimI-like enzyme
MDIEIGTAAIDDAEQILALQKIAFQREAELNGDFQIRPLAETLDELLAAFASHNFLIARNGKEIVGSVRLKSDGRICHIGRLFVAPGFQGKGIGKRLMQAAEDEFPDAETFRLITGRQSADNIRLYEKLGYRITGETMENGTTPLVIMEKMQGSA